MRTVTPAPAPAQRPNRPHPAEVRWIPANEIIEVAGRRLPGGMVYVGSGLKTRWGTQEPALIAPNLPVDRTHSDPEGRLMSYWPSYSEIEPASRAAYLDWLASGRSDPEYSIGYVFLFFYGLERRVLVDGERDAAVAGELSAIVAEVERLLEIYGSNGSFSTYAGAFLQLCRWKKDPQGIDARSLPLFGWEVPFAVRAALARCSAAASPVPSDLAFAWVFNGLNASRRTAATRCSTELRELFRIRYTATHGEGFRLERKGRTALRLEYRAASSAIGQVALTIQGLQDPTQEGPPASLTALAGRCVEELDPYSRWLGRRRADQPLLPGLALLPSDLLHAHDARELADLRGWLGAFPTGNGPVVIDASELFARWPDAADGKITRAEGTALAQFLDKLGFGIEPDVRFLGPPPSAAGAVVLFRLPPERPAAPSQEYMAAEAILQFASALAAADGVDESETRFLTEHVTNVLGLAPGERVRLAAHLLWLLREPRTPTQLKKLANELSLEKRLELAQFLVCVAGADGTVSKKEIALLTRIYASLGLEEKLVYSHLHGLGSEASVVGEPVMVKTAAPAAGAGFEIPRPPERSGEPTPGGFQLDMARVEARIRESAAVSAVLSNIFRGDEEPPAPLPPSPSIDPVAGLDAGHSALVRRLGAAPSWPRAEWTQLCASLGLLPDGAVDTVNEAALDACGDVVLSGDDPLEVDSTILQELLA